MLAEDQAVAQAVAGVGLAGDVLVAVRAEHLGLGDAVVADGDGCPEQRVDHLERQVADAKLGDGGVIAAAEGSQAGVGEREHRAALAPGEQLEPGRAGGRVADGVDGDVRRLDGGIGLPERRDQAGRAHGVGDLGEGRGAPTPQPLPSARRGGALAALSLAAPWGSGPMVPDEGVGGEPFVLAVGGGAGAEQREVEQALGVVAGAAEQLAAGDVLERRRDPPHDAHHVAPGRQRVAEPR